MEEIFTTLNKSVETVQQKVDEPYLDSLTIALETLLGYDMPANEYANLDQEAVQQALQDFNLEQYQTEDIRKAVQFAILKGMKDSTQSQHFMTPESVSLMIGYLAGKLFHNQESLRIFDPACGTGSLLTTVVKHLNKQTEVFGSEVDQTLLRLAFLHANLQQEPIEFFHQDSLRPLLLDPVDLVIADLPVGYYPDDARANDYELQAEEGHAYAHHLFIEQSMTYVKEAGYLIFVIPDSLFDSDQSDKLHAYLQNNAHIVGMLQLPESAFKTENKGKNLLILQKKGSHTATPKQPLLVQLPSFKNTKAMNDILDQMNSWFENHIT